MKRLSEQGYWESIYRSSLARDAQGGNWRTRLRDAMRNYPNFLIWEKIFPKYLTGKTGQSVLEIGCAPGNYLVAFSSYFKMEPYGLEYAPSGVQATRERFEKAGLDPAHIMEADFFDDAFLNAHAEQFDVVYSRGFIEHFDDPAAVVARHARFLKPGGLLIILIPNLQGVNKFLAASLNPKSYAIHNTSIMRTDAFKNLFESNAFTPLEIGYVGGFSFGLFNAEVPTKSKLLRILNLLQKPFDWLWRICSPLIRVETPWTSPYLLAIVKKN